MDIAKSISDADIEIFSVLRAVMGFYDQQRSLVKGREPTADFSLDVQSPGERASVKQVLDAKERLILDSLERLGKLHPLEREAV